MNVAPKRKYDRVSAFINWPLEYQFRWVKKGSGYVCQCRVRDQGKRWTCMAGSNVTLKEKYDE